MKKTQEKDYIYYSTTVIKIIKVNIELNDDEVFLKNNLEIENKLLNAEKSAFTVEKNLSSLKIQFLFTFLNISHIFVTEKSAMIGMITKEDFILKSNKIEDQENSL